LKLVQLRRLLNTLKRDGIVLSKIDAKIGQVDGVLRALDMVFRKMAVTVAGFNSHEISVIRKIAGEKTVIFSVCNTCVSEKDLKYIFKADLVWASASKIIREKVGERAKLQLGVAIPVYAISDNGKNIVLEYLKHFNEKIVVFRRSFPYRVLEREPIVEL